MALMWKPRCVRLVTVSLLDVCILRCLFFLFGASALSIVLKQVEGGFRGKVWYQKLPRKGKLQTPTPINRERASILQRNPKWQTPNGETTRTPMNREQVNTKTGTARPEERKGTKEGLEDSANAEAMLPSCEFLEEVFGPRDQPQSKVSTNPELLGAVRPGQDVFNGCARVQLRQKRLETVRTASAYEDLALADTRA